MQPNRMNLDEQVRAYLWDIREAAREIARITRGVSFEKFEKNKVLRYAVERQLHVIGEVTAQISPRFQKGHPEIDWDKLMNLRQMIERQYGETLAKRIWLTATEGLPEILKPLEKLLSE